MPTKPDWRAAPDLTRLHCGELVISGIKRYRRSLKVIRKQTKPIETPRKEKGQKIKYLSQSSLNRLAFTALNCQQSFASILTLTYSEQWPSNGREVKTHLNGFLTKLRRKYSVSYIWFLEFQRRGAPHVHLLLTIPVTQADRDWMARAWVRSTGTDGLNAAKMESVHRHPRSWEAVRNEDGARRYALKYALKTEQKAVPGDFQDVGRFWGCSLDVSRSSKEVQWEADASEFEVAEACRKLGRPEIAEWDFVPADVWLPDGV